MTWRTAHGRSSAGAPGERAKRSRKMSALAIAVPVTLLGGLLAYSAGDFGASAVAPVGQGFTVTPADLAFILQQIKIAEAHVATTTPETGLCSTLIGPGPDQIASPLLSLGLRTVDGSCNNLEPGQEHYGAADQAFPRLVPAQFNAAESVPPGFGPPGPTSYAQTAGLVFDSEPRTISNLIVDQTSRNPAAAAAAGFPVRTQGNDGIVACIAPGDPAGCVPAGETLFIPNVTTDVGLSPPYNSLFTLFGQFFDHGIDFTGKGGNGSVFVPLKTDDPLVLGPDGLLGTGDDLPPSLRFMVLTRATVDANRDATNRDSPFVDQSQTYASHSSHQVFLREFAMNVNGHPVDTGRLLGSADGGMATWGMLKDQAPTLLGLELSDSDVFNIPMLAADPYGNFIPGANGLPQYVTASGLVGGDLTTPVAPPADVVRISTAFLDDIAHNAAPKPGLAPDADGGITGFSGVQPAGTYDDEMLDAHFTAGDGRTNENIGLIAVHQIFHSEHDRLVADIKNTVLTDTSGVTNLADWQSPTGAPDADGVWNGARLFQAARFVTEMEYQHLVFEEFARKVQPAINPFQPFAFTQTDIDPAVVAEFAHAVYRFGHSMLTDSIDRINEDGSRNDISLLDGFLNPPEYTDGGSVGVLTSKEAAGSIIMGMSDQAGNEIDEFVTETLRNKLLGLPLDLAAINLTRARSEGIPSLNSVRRQLHAMTNDGQLTPYTDWVSFGLALKHPESLVNFVAAYGTHPTIQAQGTYEGKREAARLIVNPNALDPAEMANVPADASDFLNALGDWQNQGTTNITGLDDVDLWIGGLAENTNLFGGLLGSTFNFVFEYQLTTLQDADRLYYLARTPGMNLRSQLEGNSFAEIIMRNTNAHTLKADAFATADCKFQLGSNPGIAGPINGNTVTNDPISECDETALLIRMADGTIRYRSTNSVDPPGINGQSVYNGTGNVDRVYGGNDNDTFHGNGGADIIDGGGGDDVTIGGEGNDIITDFGGFDVPKGGPGNDAIDAGVNDDILMGGDGNDFSNGGANINVTFAGNGNDFAIAGEGEDVVFGDAGDDWAEGGTSPDLLIGDSSSLMFDDHNLPGHDVLIGQSGDDDYDLEGGDDIGINGQGIEKIAGAAGWDWEINFGNNQPMDNDLNLPLIGLPLGNNAVRDRFNEVEALSGWNGRDILRGDDLVPSTIGGGGFIGCDALDQDGLNRITGLAAIVPPLTVPSAPIAAAAATSFCMLDGNVWGEGNILLGGSGVDVLEGRGADDIIDGDRFLRARLSVRSGPALASPQLGVTNLMTGLATGGNFGPDTTGMTLQQAVFAGKVDPGNIFIVRDVLSTAGPADCPLLPSAPIPTTALNCDTAVFSGTRAEYTITLGAGFVNVDHNGGIDGIDRVFNVERLQFLDQAINVAVPVAQLSTTSVDFGVRSVGAPPLALPVTISNVGNGPLTVSSVVVGGASAASFTAVNGCTTVAPGGNCTINVSFLSTGPAGGRTGQLVITHDAAGSPTVVALTGQIVVNTAPVGVPTVDDPNPTEGSALTASAAGITDADGTAGSTFSFQWQQNGLGGAGAFVNIAGATGPTFTPLQAQVTRRLRVLVTFTDGHGRTESVASASSVLVVGDLFPGVGDDNSGADTRTGTAGEDRYAGGAGADTLSTGLANDLVSGDAGDDTINTGAGNDVIRFSGTGEGFDAVTGALDLDVIEAMTDGTDIGLRSVAGVETITANAHANVRILGSAAADTLNFAAVTLSGIVSINGGDGADVLTGSTGDDVILGGNDGDSLAGGLGVDVLEGGAGNDAMNSGGGADFFRFLAGFGNDTITGFDANATGGQDLLDVRQLGITAGTFVANVAIADGSLAANGGIAGSTLITIGGQTIRLLNIAPGAINQTDFVLAP
jgi:Ca2+-binding RTX toxin-like protein